MSNDKPHPNAPVPGWIPKQPDTCYLKIEQGVRSRAAKWSDIEECLAERGLRMVPESMVRDVENVKKAAGGQLHDAALSLNTLDTNIMDMQQRIDELETQNDGLKKKYEAMTRERNDWAEALRSVAPGCIASPESGRAAIEALKDPVRRALRDLYEIGATRGDIATRARVARQIHEASRSERVDLEEILDAALAALREIPGVDNNAASLSQAIAQVEREIARLEKLVKDGWQKGEAFVVADLDAFASSTFVSKSDAEAVARYLVRMRDDACPDPARPAIDRFVTAILSK